MARDNVLTFEEFIDRFPAGGTATASFNADKDKQEIVVQVKQSNDRFLTYIHRMNKQSHETVKRQVESLIERLDKAGLDHDSIIDDTPGELEYHHEFFNGIEAWLRLSRSNKSMDCKWSDINRLKQLVGNEQTRFKNEYRAWRDQCLNDFALRTGERIAVVEI